MNMMTAIAPRIPLISDSLERPRVPLSQRSKSKAPSPRQIRRPWIGQAKADLRSIRAFRPKDWLRRWIENGNSAEILSDGSFCIGFGSGDAEVRHQLQADLNLKKGARRVRAYMLRLGYIRMWPVS